jgi:hypothetical protein
MVSKSSLLSRISATWVASLRLVLPFSRFNRSGYPILRSIPSLTPILGMRNSLPTSPRSRLHRAGSPLLGVLLLRMHFVTFANPPQSIGIEYASPLPRLLGLSALAVLAAIYAILF